MNKTIKFLKVPQNLNECFEIREKVFVDEQKFAKEIEIDEIDEWANHILLLENEKPVATARYFKKNDEWHIGRFCVLKEKRNSGLGIFLMNEIEKDIAKKGDNYIKLSSQYPVKDFYKKLGYKEVGELYLEENYPHIKMEKIINKKVED